MSNSARLAIPGTGHSGYGYLYDETNNEWDLVNIATQAELDTVSTTASGAVPKSLVDAAGDLLVGTADNTVGRLPAPGSSGLVLKSNTALANKMEWGTDSTGGGGGLTITEVNHSTPTGTTETIDLSAGNFHRMQHDADLTLTLSNIPAGRSIFWMELYRENNTTERALVWFANAKHDGGVVPYLAPGANYIHSFECWVYNGGTHILVHHGGSFG